MAELKFDIIGDLTRLKKDISKVAKVKLGGLGGKGGGGDSGKQTGLLGGILKGIAPLAILLSLKPIKDTLEILKGFVIYGLGKIIENIMAIPDALSKIFGGLGKLFSGDIDFEEYLTTLISNPITSFSAWLAGFILNKITDFGEWLADFILKPIKNFDNWLAGFIINKLKDFGSWLAQFIPQPIKDFGVWLAGFIYNPIKDFGSWLKGILGLSSSGISESSQSSGVNYARDLYAGKNPSYYSVNDAIITKTGQVIKTNPNDTIIATQNAGGSGGNLTINMYGVTQEDFITEIEMRLGARVNMGSRY